MPNLLERDRLRPEECEDLRLLDRRRAEVEEAEFTIGPHRQAAAADLLHPVTHHLSNIRDAQPNWTAALATPN